MAVKCIGSQMTQLARRDPFALIVAIKQIAVRAKIHSVRRTQPRCEWRQISVRRDLHTPTTPRHLRLVTTAEADVQRHVEIARRVARRAERELVVIARQAPAIAYRAELVRDVISVGVTDSR